jgi:hypothetical protein
MAGICTAANPRCQVCFATLVLLHYASAFTSVAAIANKYCEASGMNFVAQSLPGHSRKLHLHGNKGRASATSSMAENKFCLNHNPNVRRMSSSYLNGPFSPVINLGRQNMRPLTLLTTSSSSSEFSSESVAQPAPLDHAERYTSADWLRALLTIPTSNLLRRVSFHLFGNTLFASLVWMAYTKWPLQMKMLTAGFNPQHMLLLSNALALLLVFRTNTAYDRYWEARRLWEFLISRIREV